MGSVKPDRRRNRTNLIGLIVCAIVMVFAPMAGLLITTYLLRRSFHAAETGDPSEKAKVLAEGISEAMNATACGIVIALLMIPPIAFFIVRMVRESRRPKSGTEP